MVITVEEMSMLNRITTALIIMTTLTGCSSVPMFSCSDTVITEREEMLWPSNDANTDDDGDGKIDHIERISSWDFRQIVVGLQFAAPNQQFQWTNPSTCNTIKYVPSDFFEDESKGLLFKHACRNLKIEVYDEDMKYVGTEHAQACRHFSTHIWEIY